MLKLNSGTVGIAHGDVVLFSDFEDDGPMWRGEGPRESRSKVSFGQAYRTVPHVQVSVSMLDMSHVSNVRLDVHAENISESDFDIVFRTWADSKVARVRVAWTSIGELPDEDTWHL